MTTTHAKKMQEYRDTRRENFLKASGRALARKGIRQTTMDDVAIEAGVAKMVLYRYFGSKNKLVNSVLKDFVDEILEADATATEWWTERVRNTLTTARNNTPALILLLRHSAYDSVFGEHYERLRTELTKRVSARLIETLGDRVDGSQDSQYIATTITTFFLNSYLHWLEVGNPEQDDEFFKWVTKTVQSMSYFWFKKVPPQD